jgi:hypothetical protein
MSAEIRPSNSLKVDPKSYCSKLKAPWPKKVVPDRDNPAV